MIDLKKWKKKEKNIGEIEMEITKDIITKIISKPLKNLTEEEIEIFNSYNTFMANAEEAFFEVINENYIICCPACYNTILNKAGFKLKSGGIKVQRYQCKECGRLFI